MPAVTHLDWNDVHHFVTLVEQETLTAASEVLDVQHSTVSRRIMQLEASLGLRLFDRIGKRYLLTEDGERLYMQARELSKNIAVFQRLAREQREAVTEVAISMPPVVLRWLLSPHLSAFYAQHPSIRLLLQSSAQLSNLHERQADIALRLLRPEANDLVVRRLRPLRFGRRYANHCGSPRHPHYRSCKERFDLRPLGSRAKDTCTRQCSLRHLERGLEDRPAERRDLSHANQIKLI